jgi:hypothetical protein
MTSRVQLNNIDHADLRVHRERSAELGDGLMSCPAFPAEFRELQAYYPIVFSRTGQEDFYRPFALLGLQQGENLYLTDDGWDAYVLPMFMRMQPFLIGLSSRGGEQEMEVHIDMNHPRVTTEGGERVFLEHGGQTPYLQEVAGLLGDIHDAEQHVAPFSSALEELGLIEPFTLDVELNSGESGRLTGFSTIAEERLYALGRDELGQLQERGFLQPVYMMVASLAQLRGLVERKNRRAASS